MSVTREELDRFHEFAASLIAASQSDLTWRQLFGRWRLENPSVDEHADDIVAIQEALDAMDAGRMRAFASFDSDFRERHNIASRA